MMRQLVVGLAVLLITPAAAQGPGRCPIVGLQERDLKLEEGFPNDPRRHPVSTGRDVNLKTCQDPRIRQANAYGWVALRPDYIVRWTTRSGGSASSTLTFKTESSGDTILLIADPRGKWHFSDDVGTGRNAKIRFENAQPGRYDIWVGSFKEGALPTADLVITELD